MSVVDDKRCPRCDSLLNAATADHVHYLGTLVNVIRCTSCPAISYFNDAGKLVAWTPHPSIKPRKA